MKKPYVSIITITYNHEEYIEKCITSVLSQTFSRWELIIVDDCSSDKTANIVLKYTRSDSRVALLRHKTNWGVKQLSQSYNEALMLAKGKYVAILEGDDYWPHDKLEKQLKYFSVETILTYGDAIIVNKNSRPIDIVSYNNYPEKNLNNRPPSNILPLFFDINFYIETVSVIIRKSALQKTSGFIKSRSYPFIDIPTWLFLSLEGEFRYVPEILGFYRKHEDSTWFKFASQTDAMTRSEIKNLLTEFLQKESKKINSLSLNHDFTFLRSKLDHGIVKKIRTKNLSMLKHYTVFMQGNLIREYSKNKDLKAKDAHVYNRLFGSAFVLNNLHLFIPFYFYPKFCLYKTKRLTHRIRRSA